MGRSAVREKVQQAVTNDELDRIFDEKGFFMDEH